MCFATVLLNQACNLKIEVVLLKHMYEYLGGPDGTVTDDLGHQGANQSLALVSWAAQVLDPVAVAHHSPLHARLRGHQSALCTWTMGKAVNPVSQDCLCRLLFQL